MMSGEDLYVTIPLGGPIYVPDLVGPLTRVPDFETYVCQKLQSLKEELCEDSIEMCDEDISVDELKIIQKDELVNKALEEEALKDFELAIDASQVREDHLSPRSDDNSASCTEHGSLRNGDEDMKAIVSSGPSNVLNQKKNRSGKKKHNKRKNPSLDESYVAKVQELARVKQKQEEDKAGVRLHSFKVLESGAIEKADKIKSLKSGSVTTKMRTSNTGDYMPVQFPEAVLSFEV